MTSFGHASALLSGFHSSEQSLQRIQELTGSMEGNDFNDVLRNDLKLVLPFDMLVKVDLMSMANSLEVRTPFLDVEVVEAALSFPSEYKINSAEQKKILKDTFSHLLPQEVFTRKKQGFEVPLLRWMRTSLKPMMDELLSVELLEKQQLFNIKEVQRLRQEINRDNPGEATARLWALLVFQHWWVKNILR